MTEAPGKSEEVVLVPTYSGDTKSPEPSITLTLDMSKRFYSFLGSRLPNSSQMTQNVIIHIKGVLKGAFAQLGGKITYTVDLPRDMIEGSKTEISWKWDLKTHPDARQYTDQDGEPHPGVRDQDVTLGNEELYKNIAQQLKDLPQSGHFKVVPVVKGEYSDSKAVITLNVKCSLVQMKSD